VVHCSVTDKRKGRMDWGGELLNRTYICFWGTAVFSPVVEMAATALGVQGTQTYVFRVVLVETVKRATLLMQAKLPRAVRKAGGLRLRAADQ